MLRGGVENVAHEPRTTRDRRLPGTRRTRRVCSAPPVARTVGSVLDPGSTSRSRHLLVALAAFLGLGCPGSEQSADASKADSAKAPEAKAATPAEPPEEKSPEEPAEAELPPDGWSRVELSSVATALSGTVDVPSGVEAEQHTIVEGDVDGLQTNVVSVKLGAVTLRPLVEVPPRFASAKAMRAFHEAFEEVSTHDFGPDHWAVVQRWRPGECMLHGWSKDAGLSCDVFKAPCDEMKQWVDSCGSLQAGDAPNVTTTTPRSAFESLDPAAAEVAVTVARAIARNEAATLVEAAADDGLTVGGKKLAKADLEAALAGKPVAETVALGYATDGSPRELYQWNADGSPSDPTTATVWFSSGYGEQPYFRIRKIGDAWKLTEFGTEDLGEP